MVAFAPKEPYPIKDATGTETAVESPLAASVPLRPFLVCFFFNQVAESIPFNLPMAHGAAEPYLSVADPNHLPITPAMSTFNTDFLANIKRKAAPVTKYSIRSRNSGLK